MQQKMEELMKKVDEMEQQTVVKLGDASIASPFTSKYNSPISSESHALQPVTERMVILLGFPLADVILR